MIKEKERGKKMKLSHLRRDSIERFKIEIKRREKNVYMLLSESNNFVLN